MNTVNKLMDDLIAIPTENLSVKSNKSIANAVCLFSRVTDMKFTRQMLRLMGIGMKIPNGIMTGK